MILFFLSLFAGILTVLAPVVTIFPALYEKLPLINSLNRSSNRLLAAGYQKHNRLGDIIIGAALGPVFSSCSPTYFLILATVLPGSFGAGLVYLLAYAVGLCGALLACSVAGQKFLSALGVASDPGGWFKRSVGILLFFVGVAILFGYDKKLELALANKVFDVTRIEQSLLQSQESGGAKNAANIHANTNVSIASSSAPSKPVPSTRPQNAQERIAVKESKYPKAPEIVGPSGFVNTGGRPITLGEFRGKKVVLVDFWTYSCINCQRTIPYVKAWHEKYARSGLEIVSIHTPEFAFEKVQSNVARAVKDFGITYPVVLDNNYGTWGAFGNQFWPRKYLIDIDGYIVYDHIGEGNYDETEAAIRKALRERAAVLGTSEPVSGAATPENIVQFDPGKVGSPETYFGSARNQYLANGAAGESGVQTLTVPQDISSGKLFLGGTWNFAPEYAESASTKAIIVYRFRSKDVYFVASSARGVKIKITIDGGPVAGNAGADVAADGTAIIKDNRLYALVHMPEYGEHTLRIEIEDAGLDAYTFTFG
ncbi:MAG: redoxin family protein [Candidatus Sungbacteria bacterium]|uniref:Redoxin family protein n=1 Tax=Candidatus Sungiibacteriota bacterium TaxID=2750080 RepID=A0A932R1I2_9BACT|nr:redoxin family protein [Candidatus Sungbacteria bacterium]